MIDYKEKIEYFDRYVKPGLSKAFKSGMQHHNNPRMYERAPDEDIRHIRELHVDVRLREAEDAADGEDFRKALGKIESAIGYLTILHYRLTERFYKGE